MFEYLDVKLVFAPKAPICGTCRYWRKDKKGDEGVCFRYPRNEQKTRTDSCGEHPWSDAWFEFHEKIEENKRKLKK